MVGRARIKKWTRWSASHCAAAVVLSVAALGVLGCGGGGGGNQLSLYCRGLYLTAGRLDSDRAATLVKAQAEPLTLILVGSNVRLPTILEAMVEHAPRVMLHDTEVLLEESHEIEGRPSNSKGNAVGRIRGRQVGELAKSAAYSGVDRYLQRNCPLNSVIAEEALVLAATR